MKNLWSLVAVSAVLAAAGLILTIIYANSAPQQAAGAALAVGVAVIPYVFARAMEKTR